MKKIAAAILVACAGTAFADIVDRSGYEIYTATATEIGTQARGSSTLYSNQDGPYSAFDPAPAADNPLGFADYYSIATQNIDVSEFIFVGGVDTAGAVLFFDFFDGDGTNLDGFGVALPSAGDFIWTITIISGLEIAANGFVQMTIDDGSFGPAGAGRWFLTENAASVGDEGSPDFPPGFNGFNFAFTINGAEVPAPAGLAVVGLGGLAAARRRR